MKISFKYLVVLIVGIAFVLNSCKKECPCDDPTDPVCDNYDPCYGKKSVNTYFKVRPGDRGFGPPEEWCQLVPCDTFNASSVRFDAPDGNPENSTYEWQIGSEAEPRKGKGFEVDFSDYLIAGKWETWISVSLTIRTPINDCLENPKDTLVTVTRELFFTEKRPTMFLEGKNSAHYKGYFTSSPTKAVIIEFVYLEEGSFRGLNAPMGLVIGIPNTDTIIFPPKCRQTYCFNYLHTIGNVGDPEGCYPESHNYISQFEMQSLNGANRIKRNWLFAKPSGVENYEFIGERVE